MKFRNSWKSKNKQWSKFALRCRLGFVDVLTIEIDRPREFYMITILNWTLKNR